MGRRASAEPCKRVNVRIEEKLLARFSMHHFDPSQRSGYEYGALSKFINDVLRKELSIYDIKLPEED